MLVKLAFSRRRKAAELLCTAANNPSNLSLDRS